MLRNLVSVSNKFYEDQALIFMTFGGFGRYVLSILFNEFNRLGIPEDKMSFMAFDTERSHRDNLDLESESDYFFHLDEFDGDVYIENEENRELKEAVNHVPINLFRDIEGGCKGIPAVGFVAFHKYDDLFVTRQALRIIDDMRAKNPGKKLKLIVISGMGGSVSNGMTVPFLYRIKDRLREKKIRVEVFLATSEGYLGMQNVQEDGVERNCVASAMLWEYAMAGRNGLTYPGKNGFRDRRLFDGKIAHRIYVFSGGSAETSLKYQAIASTIAQCITTLELTKVGSYLDGDRVNYSAHILEREWKGNNGNTHPTGLLTMNVAGFKGDCLPQIFHLHMVKRFLQDLIKPLRHPDEDKTRGEAISSFLENNLNEDDILHRFKIDFQMLSPEDINQASVSEEDVYEFIKDKITNMDERADVELERKKKLEEVTSFTERAIESFVQRGDDIILRSGHYSKGGLIFYEKLASLLDEKIKTVNGSISRVEKELIEGSNQKTLDNLLEKLGVVTEKRPGAGDLVLKLGRSPTISLVKQILDVASKIQQQKKEKYNHLLLQYIYDRLLKFVHEKQENLKKVLYNYNKVVSLIDREVETITRVARSSFTYNKSKFDELTEHLMDRIYSECEVISTHDVMEKLSQALPENKAVTEIEYLQELIKIIKPDLTILTRLVDDLLCNDEKVYDYLQGMLDQFYLTLKLDRDRFPTLETSRCSFVICAKKFYDKYKEDLFEGYSHIESDNPLNIIVTKHEEGFPFIAMSYMHRINDEFKELYAHDKSVMGHIMANMDNVLPLLDA